MRIYGTTSPAENDGAAEEPSNGRCSGGSGLLVRCGASVGSYWVPLFLFLAGSATGMVYVSSWGGTPHFFQELFGPSAMFACGRGFENPVLEQAPDLNAFLHPALGVDIPLAQDCLPCSALPEAAATQPLDPFQRRQLYLLWAAALAWRVFGVAWSSLTPLYGLLCGGTALAAYGLFRLAMNRGVAGVCTVLLILSPIQLNNLVRLRDYSKAPFILGAILLMAWLVKGPCSRRKLMVTSMAGGALLGLGCGFRMDTLIGLPAFAAVLLFFVEPHPLRHVGRRAVAIALCAASFLATSYPVYMALDTGMKYQDFLLGLNDLYDSRLGVGGAPYQVGHRYFDYEPLALLQTYGSHQTGRPVYYTFDTPEYEAIGKSYTHQIVKTFPGDLMTRALAAVVRTVDELTSSVEHPAPRGVTNAFALKIYDVHAYLTSYALRYARYAILLTLMLLSLRNLRWAFAALFFLLYFGGYGAVQFASRHYFHLQFLSFWAVGFLLAFFLSSARTLACQERRARFLPEILGEPFSWRRVLARPVLLGMASLLAIGVPLMAFREWQTAQVRPILQGYERAGRHPVTVQTEDRGDGTLLVRGTDGAGRVSLPEPPENPYFAMEYLVAEFDTSQGPISFTAQYAGSVQDLALSWPKTLAQAPGVTRVYFPVYYARWAGSGKGWTRYEGLALSEKDAGALKGLYRIDEPQQFRLLLTATLVPGWEKGPLYQRFVR